MQFGTEEGDEVKIFWSWMGKSKDVRNRIKRTGMPW